MNGSDESSDAKTAPWLLPGLFFVFMLVAGVLVIILAGIALFEIGFGLYLYAAGSSAHGNASTFVIAHVLKGVELLFLSALPYLIVAAVGDYLRHFTTRSGKGPRALHKVEQLKKMTVSLMIAVVATELVQRFLSGNGLERDEALIGCLLIVVFSLFLVALERGARPRPPRATLFSTPSSEASGGIPELARGRGGAKPTKT